MQAKRGYVPKDERYFSSEALDTMRMASEHVCYLIDHGYDLKRASTFVGDHFQLSGRQRIAVTRSVATKGQLANRRARELPVDRLGGQDVWVDGFNTIISLEVMLSDSTLLSCMDGAIRDLASLRGTYRVIPVTADAIRLLFDVLRDAGVRQATILLDEPVSNSGRLKMLLADIGETYPFALEILIVKWVDRLLFGKERVVTSDSLILDHCESWVNLARHCMELRGKQAFEVWGRH